MTVLGRARRCCAAVVLMGVAACSPGSTKPPAAASCDVSALADWQERGLAVLLIQEDRTEKLSLGGMDVRDGNLKVRCNLPEFSEPYHALPMARNGAGYTRKAPNRNSVLWRTQWISPSFRWIVSGDEDVVDVRTGRHHKVIDSGQVTAVGDGIALARNGSAWCFARLAGDKFGRCEPLKPLSKFGAFVLDTSGRPVWISADARPLRASGGEIGTALTDGERVYRAEFAPPEKEQPGSQVDPTGRALFTEGSFNNPPPGYQPYDWFTIDRVEQNQILLRSRRSSVTSDAFRDFAVSDGQYKAAISDGSAAVFSYTTDGDTEGSRVTSFFMLVEGESKIFDLSGDRGVICPGMSCQILAWPDISLDLATKGE